MQITKNLVNSSIEQGRVLVSIFSRAFREIDILAMQSWITMRLAFKKLELYICSSLFYIYTKRLDPEIKRYNIGDAYSYGGLVSFDSRLR